MTGRQFEFGWGIDLLALLAGALLPLAFAPFGFYPIAPLSIALLIGAWLHADPRRAFWRGWLFGIGQFGVGVSWIYVSIERYGNAAPFVAPLVTVVFVAILALYPALVGYLGRRLVRRNKALFALLGVPALWVLAEWLRGWALTGFPWLDLGYSQIDSPLACLAPLLGVHGVSAAVAFSGGVLVVLTTGRRRLRVSVLAMGVAVWVGATLLDGLNWVTARGAPLSVSIVQGNIEQARKWEPAEADNILESYRKLSETEWGRDLILWPETAVPMFLRDAADFIAELAVRAEETGTELVFGVPTLGQVPRQYYNSVAVVGDELGIYRKRHLVPFGEYFPFRSALRWLNFLEVPMADFAPGVANPPPLMVKGQPAGITICYEIAYSDLVRSNLPTAAFLITVSNDAWFGDSLAPHQHLQIARMRAFETGRYLLRATNTGISAIIDNRGRVQGVTPQDKTAVLTGEIQPMTGTTPFVRWGLTPVLIVMALMLAAAVSGDRLSRRSPLPRVVATLPWHA